MSCRGRGSRHLLGHMDRRGVRVDELYALQLPGAVSRNPKRVTTIYFKELRTRKLGCETCVLLPSARVCKLQVKGTGSKLC